MVIVHIREDGLGKLRQALRGFVQMLQGLHEVVAHVQGTGLHLVQDGENVVLVVLAAGQGQAFRGVRQLFQGLPVPLEEVFHGVIVDFPQLERAVHDLVAAHVQNVFLRNLVKTLYGKLVLPLAVHDGGFHQDDDHQGQQPEDGVHLPVVQDGRHDGGPREGRS